MTASTVQRSLSVDQLSLLDMKLFHLFTNRILSRVLPFMLESESESVKSLCWRKQALPKPITPLSDLATAGTVPSPGEDGEPELKLNPPADARESEPLAVVLVNAMFHLLFLPEFTIEDPKMDFSEVRTLRTLRTAFYHC
jgi:High-temperature-induced dauer-formation protein